jgi:predicted membrane protein
MVITNENFIDSAPGQKDAIRVLAHQDFIYSVEFVSHSHYGNQEQDFVQVLSALLSVKYDVVMIWSPKSFPETADKFEQLISAIGGRPIYYWEGDPWTKTGVKKWTNSMKWWASKSQIIFSVAMEPHKAMFQSVSNAKFLLVPQTYCHIQFSNEEQVKPPEIVNSKSVVMIGNQSAKVPFLYGTPGSGVRFLAATSLKFRLGEDFQLYGKGWPRAIATGVVKYQEQAKLIRNFSMSANWDNFTQHESYASDRLPISLLAGRVHITSSHPGINYYGDEDIGLTQVTALREMHSKIYELRRLDPLKLSRMGLEAHNWAKYRFSHREAARFMFSHISNEIPRLQMQPWASL